mmetsp:Transcript_13187/g.48077  ORF Transcript_13187/g.48077 Transcript_13187/m.48077 type:complete len:187 (-) Transcript_13187:72-632(-)
MSVFVWPPQLAALVGLAYVASSPTLRTRLFSLLGASSGRVGASQHGRAASMELIVHPMVVYRQKLAEESVVASPPLTLESLPFECLQTIASHLSKDCEARDLCALACTTKTMRQFADDESHWRTLCCRKFGLEGTESPESWKKLYQFNHDILYRVLLDPNLQDILDQAYPRLSGPVYVPRMAASSG